MYSFYKVFWQNSIFCPFSSELLENLNAAHKIHNQKTVLFFCMIIYKVFWQNSTFCPFESISINLYCSVKCRSIKGNSITENQLCAPLFPMSQPTNDVSPLGSVLLQLTHKIKILLQWSCNPTRYFHSWISSGSCSFNS